MVDAINHGDAIRELLHARINHDFDAERRALKVLFRSMIDIALRPSALDVEARRAASSFRHRRPTERPIRAS
jgi:hypothetical protein